MGYVAWNKTTNNTTTTYKIELLQRSINEKGDASYSTFMTWEQTENFFKLTEAYKANPDIFVQVSQINDNVVSVGEMLQAYPLDDTPFKCAGCPDFTTTARWKCNGKTYAYEIQKLEPIPANGGYILALQASTVDYYDPINQIGTPYYYYYDESTIPLNQSPYMYLPSKFSDNTIITIYDAANEYVNATGTLISFPNVGAIEKKAEEFWGQSYSTSTPTAYSNVSYLSPSSTMLASASLSFAIDQFNTYAPPAIVGGVTTRPLLECIPYPSGSGAFGYLGGSDWIDWLTTLHANVSLVAYWCPLTYSLDFGNECANNTIIDLIGSGDPIFNPAVKPENIFPIKNYSHFVVERIDGDMTPIVLNINDIYLPNGTIKKPTLKLQNKGLYQFKIFLKDGSFVPLTFEVLQNSGKGNSNNTPKQSDLVNVKIYPVPSTSPQFTMKCTATEQVNFTYSLNTLQGTQLYQANYKILKGETKTITIPCSYTTATPEMLINSFEFVDGSTKSITTLHK